MLPLIAGLGLAAPARADVNADDLAAYVRARAADADGAKRVAATGYAAALTDAPSNVVIAARAYRAALQVGDMALATRARQVLEKAGAAPPDAPLLALADAIVAGDRPGIAAATTTIAGGPFAFLTPSIRAWTMVPGDPKGALAVLSATGSNPLAARFSNESRALIEIATGHEKNASPLLDLLTGVDPASDELRINAAQLLAHQGEGDVARNLLAGSDPLLTAYRNALGNGEAPTARFGISRLFLRLAANLGDGRAAQAAIVLARAAEVLDPDNDRAQLVLAEALTTGGAGQQALAALDHIAPTSPAAEEARALRIDALASAGEQDAALKAAAALSAAPDATSEDAQRYGDLLVGANRFGEAADAYATAIARAGAAASWLLHLQLGGALDQAGRWREAEPELQKAVALAPESPVALNYLGYSQLEHGEPPEAATKLLERATTLKPDSASILDSLAWSYYLQGDIARALPMFERAVASEPANATINEHLGDAYWASGRYYEARYAWRAASVTAPAGDGARLASKIANGLTSQRPRRDRR